MQASHQHREKRAISDPFAHKGWSTVCPSRLVSALLWLLLQSSLLAHLPAPASFPHRLRLCRPSATFSNPASSRSNLPPNWTCSPCHPPTLTPPRWAFYSCPNILQKEKHNPKAMSPTRCTNAKHVTTAKCIIPHPHPPSMLRCGGRKQKEITEQVELSGSSAWQVPRHQTGLSAQKGRFQGTKIKTDTKRQRSTSTYRRTSPERRGRTGDQTPDLTAAKTRANSNERSKHWTEGTGADFASHVEIDLVKTSSEFIRVFSGVILVQS